VKVGYIGLGIMGKPIARNILKAGFHLVVHNRSQTAVDELVRDGAIRASPPQEVAEQVDVVFTNLPDSPDVEKVIVQEHGILAGAHEGMIYVDNSTISPMLARKMAGLRVGKGVMRLDAPVSGGEIGAINGTLSIMVGGDAAALERVRPVLNAVGNRERIVHIGPSGAGQVCKACNQICIGGALAAVGEAFAIARKAGIDPAKVREALLGGFAASRVLEVHGERILKGNYVPGFKTRLYHKDLGIVGQTIHELQVPAPVAALVQQYVSALMAAGLGDEDYSALAKAVFDAAGLE